MICNFVLSSRLQVEIWNYSHRSVDMDTSVVIQEDPTDLKTGGVDGFLYIIKYFRSVQEEVPENRVKENSQSDRGKPGESIIED